MNRKLTWTEVNEIGDDDLLAQYRAQENRTDEQIIDDVHSEVVASLWGANQENKID